MHIIGCKEDLCEVAFAIGSSVAVRKLIAFAKYRRPHRLATNIPCFLRSAWVVLIGCKLYRARGAWHLLPRMRCATPSGMGAKSCEISASCTLMAWRMRLYMSRSRWQGRSFGCKLYRVRGAWHLLPRMRCAAPSGMGAKMSVIPASCTLMGTV